MHINTVDLASITQAKAKLADELRKLEEQETALRQQAASKAFEQIIELLNSFGSQFGSKQKSEIAGYVTSSARPKTAQTAPNQQAAPKYWLPHTQETWSGRGRPPKAFAAWIGTSAYNDWKKNHPNDKFPKFPG